MFGHFFKMEWKNGIKLNSGKENETKLGALELDREMWHIVKSAEHASLNSIPTDCIQQ